MLLRRRGQCEAHISVVLVRSKAELVYIALLCLFLISVNGCRIRIHLTLIRHRWFLILWPVWSCKKIIVIVVTLAFFLWHHIVIILKLTRSLRGPCMIMRRTLNECWGGLESFANWCHHMWSRKYGIFILIFHWIVRLDSKRLLLLNSVSFLLGVFKRVIWISRIHYHFFVKLCIRGHDFQVLVRVLARYVLNQLILAIVFNTARFACIWFIVSVSSLMILAVANSCKTLGTISAVIWLFACVSPHMNEKITFFSKYLSTIWYSALEQIMSWMSWFDV